MGGLSEGRTHMANDWRKVWPNNRRPETIFDVSKCNTKGKLKRCVTMWSQVNCPNCLKRMPKSDALIKHGD